MKTLELKSQIPAWARDLRVNLGNVLQSEHLTEQQLWGTALAVATATRKVATYPAGSPSSACAARGAAANEASKRCRAH